MHTTIESSTIAEPMDDNQALREILGEVRLNADILSERYDGIDKQSANISTEVPMRRPAKETIIKTVVTNLGGNNAQISEDGVIVNILPALQTWVSPLSGKGEILVECIAGAPTTVSMASYTRG